MALVKAIISETGNGFPYIGSYVPGDDGNLYRVVKTTPRFIYTGPSGEGDFMHGKVREASWDDISSSDVFPAQVRIPDEDES